jgi:C-terminal processing protease CtpA/Prc
MAAAGKKFPDAKGWIIDLRGNGGGGYSGALIEKLTQLPRPVVGIIDAGCMSAGETLARDLVRYAGAKLIGSATAGASSAKRSWSFPSGIATLTLSTRSRWGPDRRPIEFRGIRPQKEIEAIPEEVQRGLNSAIVIAEKYLSLMAKTKRR